MVKNTPQNREELEADIAKRLDINIDQLQEARLSDQRLTQIFEKAVDHKTKNIAAGVLLGVAATALSAFIASMAIDNPETSGTVYGAGIIGALTFILGLGIFNDEGLKNEVQAEIEGKTSQQNDGPKPPSPE